MEFQTVLFDLDGTLCDTLDDLADATNYALQTHGFAPHTREEYRYFVGTGARELIRKALEGQSQDEADRQRVYETYTAYYSTHYLVKTAPYPGLPAMLEELRRRGMRLGVVTNKPDDRAQEIVEKFFPGVFSAVAGNRPDFPTKPDPALPLHVLGQLHGQPQSTAFVGDSWVDMQTASNAGFVPVGVLWGFRERQELEAHGARFLAHNAAELLKILTGSVTPC